MCEVRRTDGFINKMNHVAQAFARLDNAEVVRLKS